MFNQPKKHQKYPKNTKIPSKKNLKNEEGEVWSIFFWNFFVLLEILLHNLREFLYYLRHF
jgi:hypothetical protein